MKTILLIGCVLGLFRTPGLAADSGQEKIQPKATEYVILLHGLARTSRSMAKMEQYLREKGFGVINAGYASRKKTIEELAETAIPKALHQCRLKNASRIHFVTHSLGGILVRYYLKHHTINNLGRVVMLSPPNQGSELADKLGGFFLYKWLNGPAGQQLGTGRSDLPSKLGPVNFELGVIAGDRSVNLILSQLIPGEDDGKVSVEKASVSGQKDFLLIPASHPFIMKKQQALLQAVYFLKNGRFDRSANP